MANYARVRARGREAHRRRGDADGGAPHHRVDGRAGAGHPAARGRSSAGRPCGEPSRGHVTNFATSWCRSTVDTRSRRWKRRSRTGDARRTGGPSIEWAMIDGTNDSDEQAALLVPIARRLGAHVNLIPLNPTPGWPTQPSSPSRIRGFVRVLKAGGVNVTVRDTRGRDIDAACGQLRWEHDHPEPLKAGLVPAGAPSPSRASSGSSIVRRVPPPRRTGPAAG